MFAHTSDGKRLISLGITTRKAACTEKNVVLVSDNGRPRSGPFTAAHELGHALGSPHDGKESSTKCSGHSGYLMTPSVNKQKKPVYSDCSKAAIKEFLRTKAAQCLFRRRCPDSANKERATAIDPEVKMRNKQCLSKLDKNEHFLNATVIRPCALRCYVTLLDTNEVSLFRRVAPDGMKCNTNGECKVCKQGECVFEV
ncbi:A disintegrin and metalloproteinase with thrombospondin motifs 17-like [Dermacentor silvarum]|uniref:A disintegrin and metalloproteinase with thrombospondin motifs 17-like n=1 Tax=Dermacentor silvarum TaxID=543639 RepID=UPI002101812E|nr:A disintegrin and metalloproteinase with thrombospondin motifs 17-like [Dermacentor silvarum]